MQTQQPQQGDAYRPRHARVVSDESYVDAVLGNEDASPSVPRHASGDALQNEPVPNAPITNSSKQQAGAEESGSAGISQKRPGDAPTNGAPQTAPADAPAAMASETNSGPQTAPDDAPEGFARLNANAMGSAAEQHAQENKRWQDVHPTRHKGTRELKHTRGWYQAVVVCIVMAIAAAGVGAGVTYYLELWGGKTVPSVVGLTSANAEERLAQKGFAVQVNYVASDNGNDRVISVDPGVGTRIDDGSTVELTVGQSRVMPSVVGKSVQEARQILEDAGATNVQLTYEASTEEEGLVLAVNPPEGSTFVGGNQVTLTVAQLPKVPDVVGRTLSDALKRLSDAGLTPTVEFTSSGRHAKGYVDATTPAAGSRADEKGSVTVTVVSPLPADEYDLPGYLEALPQALSDYLGKAGYTLTVGYEDPSAASASQSSSSDATADASSQQTAGQASADAASGVVQRMENDNGDAVVVSATPWVRNVSQPSDDLTATDVLSEATSLSGLGISIDIPADQCPQEEASQAAAEQVQTTCHLGGSVHDWASGTLSQAAEDGSSVSISYYSSYGEQDEMAWSVVVYVDGSGTTRAVASYAPKSAFDAIDASQAGGSKARALAQAVLAG